MTKQILIALAAAATLLDADTLLLRSGSRIEGNFVGGDGRSVRFASGSQVTTYNLNDVDSVRFSSGPQSNGPSSAYPQNGGFSTRTNYPPGAGNYPPPVDNGYNSGGYPQNSGNYASSAPVNGSMGLEVPAGTPIVIRLIDSANSERDSLGQTYRASVDEPVFVNGQTVIPRGSDAMATLIDAKQSGKFEGKAVLTLDLKTLTVNGRQYDIATTGVSEASGSRGARSAKVIGGAAALGAIIGAAAGGGRGAAIGAGSGAAVGTAAEVATSGQKVKVPAETRLTFTLKSPINF